ncbi:phosphoglycerate kinase [Halostella pelagica]|uniref:phosphoglycerate kinase n=1 Tax=Halostella pelagica TaxID=2583824 RepID=UPI0010805576|nr:phosphoglycerate kinase [Halostella pelagica]
MFQTLDDLAPDQRLLVRLDLNAPIEDGRAQDHRRFERHADTVQELVDDGHAVVLMAHQGRPGRDTFVSLESHADVLASHLDRAVSFVDDVYGDDALSAIDDTERGDVLLLENVRFLEDEELGDRSPEDHARSEFVQTLAPEFDAYVNDAYSAAHRAHASIVGFPQAMDAYAGRVMVDEYEYNTSIERRDFDGKVTMALGGTKAEDVIAAMDHLDETVDQFLLGGVVGELFLRSAGYPVGYDLPDGTGLYDDNYEKNEAIIERVLDEYGDRIALPEDMAYEDESGDRAEHDVDDIDEKSVSYMDVGHGTVETYAPHIEESEAVLVKGALGVFEDERFNYGTIEVLRAVADSDCFSVVGGGDTSRTVTMYDLGEENFDHLSIAGGAYLRALTGEPLAAVEALRQE